MTLRQRGGRAEPGPSLEVPIDIDSDSEVGVPDNEGIDDFEDPPADFFKEQPDWMHLLRCAEEKGESTVCESEESMSRVIQDKACTRNAPEPFFITYKAWADKARLILEAWCDESAAKAGAETEQQHTARFRACLAGVEQEQKRKACCDDELEGIFHEDVCGDPRDFPELLELSHEAHHAVVGAMLLVWCDTDREHLRCDEPLDEGLDQPDDGHSAKGAAPEEERVRTSEGQQEKQGRSRTSRSGFWKRFQSKKNLDDRKNLDDQ